ncbi:mitochondrial protein [Peniophora sp. CONT]|nr:mitochondrial protein [Peniophora sp. CONT]
MDLSVLEAPARVASVRVDGAARTRATFLASIINPQLAKERPETLEGALLATRDIGHYLREADIFSIVNAKLEPAAGRDGDVDIVFTTKEKGRYFLKTSTEVGNNEGTASATGHIRNVFGGAEHFEASVSAGTKTRRAFNGVFSAPLTGTLGTRGELSAYAADSDKSSFASCTEALRGAKVAVRQGYRRSGQHEIGYEAVLRHVGNLTESASLSIREAAGQSVKSSLFHTYVRDNRDNAIMGTRGGYLKLRHEFAGVGGDAAFYKVEGEAQVSKQLHPGVTLSLGGRAGLLHALKGQNTLFPDRFQLGGPQSVRSFRQNSLGPRDGPDSVGGDLLWAAGASLVTNIPRVPHWPLKFHAFVNAGQLDSLQGAPSLQDAIRASISQPSVSAGVGLIYAFDPVRVELNFGVPLAARKSDGFRRGVQMGIGLEFL